MMTVDKSGSRATGAESEGGLLVFVNGKLVPAHEATVSVFDSGLNFADGVFEGIRVYASRVFRLEQHVKRLYESAKAFQIDIGMTPSAFTAEILGWLRANRVRDNFHFRPIVTRGHRFPPRLDPRLCTGGVTIIFVGGPIQPAKPSGLCLVISKVRRVNPDALDPRVKSLNYGNNLLARLEAYRHGADDAIMLDGAGFVAEASASNLFIARHGQILTPWPKACLEGITRRAVMELAQAGGIPVRERDITPAEVLNADEVFLTGTGSEITPVVGVEGSPIGTGRPGPITTNLVSRYAALVHTEGVLIKS